MLWAITTLMDFCQRSFCSLEELSVHVGSVESSGSVCVVLNGGERILVDNAFSFLFRRSTC